MSKNIACECCGKIDWRFWLAKEGENYVRCVSCGLGKIEVLPSQTVLFDLYEDFAKHYYLGDVKQEIDKTMDHTKRLLELEPFKKNLRLLDLGCSTGGFLHQAKAKGWIPFGVDISPTVCQVARRLGADVFSGTIHEAKYPDSYFDVVRIWANLEHVPDPQRCILESFRVLRKGGLLLFSVPSIESLKVRILKARYRYICTGHLYYFSKKSIRALVEGAELKILKLQSEGFDFFPFFEDLKAKHSKDIQTTEAAFAERAFVEKTKKSWLFQPLKFFHNIFQGCLTQMNLGEIWYLYANKP